MKLYFLRHAEASYEAPTDHDRPLTPNGIERTKIAARVMKKLDVNPVHIYASPRIRARHTAEIIASTLGKKVEMREEVNFDFNVFAVEALIRHLKQDDEAMFVGHNPSISDVVAGMTGASVDMKKGGLARVDINQSNAMRGELVWLIAPKVFDALA